MSNSDIAFLGELEVIISDRFQHPSDESYTSQLAQSGTKRIAQKVGEEGVEVALAAASGDTEDIINEAADLLYHLLVLLTDQGLTLGAISQRLKTRHDASVV